MVSPVVLITGALAGIGRETSIAFSEQGARLVISGRRSEAGKDLARKLRELGAEVEFVRADVQFEADVAALMAATIMRFGRLDVAVNNAGTEGVLGPIVQQTKKNFHDTFNTNVLGTLFCMKYELPVMLAQGGGSIINMSSMGGARRVGQHVCIHRQQACDRRIDQVCGAGRRREWRACERHSCRPCGNGDAQTIRRWQRCSEVVRAWNGPREACSPSSRNCRAYHVPGERQVALHDWEQRAD